MSKRNIRERISKLDCYDRLHAGQLTLEDCAKIDNCLKFNGGLITVAESWYDLKIQAKPETRWLAGLLARSPRKVVHAFRVSRALGCA